MALCVKAVPAGSSAIVVGLVQVHPVDGMAVGVSVRCCLTVKLAVVVSVLLVAYGSVADMVVALSLSMYSYTGPVIVEPSALTATGTVMPIELLATAKEGSHPAPPMVSARFCRQ